MSSSLWAPQEVVVLAGNVLKLLSIAFVLCEQKSGIKTRSLRTGTRDLEIQGNEDVDSVIVKLETL